MPPLDLESPSGDVSIEGASDGDRGRAAQPMPADYLVDANDVRLRDAGGHLLTVPHG